MPDIQIYEEYVGYVKASVLTPTTIWVEIYDALTGNEYEVTVDSDKPLHLEWLKKIFSPDHVQMLLGKA